MKNLVFFCMLFTFLGVSSSYSQCMMFEIPLSDRIDASEVIFEGKVVDIKSFWNHERTNIFTANTIEVYKVFKGNITAARVEILTEGGVVESLIQKVIPSLELGIGYTGIFLAKASPVLNSPNEIASNLKFEPYASAQGFIQYNLSDQIAVDPFKTYASIEAQLYDVIQEQLGHTYLVLKQFDIGHRVKKDDKKSAAPNISGFTPATISAGTLSELTINGSGFGASYTGSAKVQFRYADNGGASYFIPAGPMKINSWSDTQIKVLVPSGAGTGTIKVTNSAGSSATSSSKVTIPFAEMTIYDNNQEINLGLTNHNTAGGYNFTYNTSFNSNAAAVAAFERALETWRCKTSVNFNQAGTTANTCTAFDGVNVVGFETVGCMLAAGILGRGVVSLSKCSSGDFAAAELDFVFRASGWNYGPGPTSGGKNDFETTVLHEMGHTMLLAHVINPAAAMHYGRGANTDVRTLTATGDITGANGVLTRSSMDRPCFPKHVKLAPGTTCNTVGIDALADTDAEVDIYPNPFTHSASVHIASKVFNSGGMVSLILSDMLGKEVKSIVNITSGYFQIRRDELSSGMYFYKLKNSEGIISSGKLIISGH